MKETDSFANENTPTPIIYHAYDPDCNGRTVAIGNIHRMTNMKWRYLRPFDTVRLNIKPRWEFLPSKFDVTETGVKRVGNPWFDTGLLQSNATQAPSMRTVNGRLIVLEHCISRIIIKHISCVMLFRGARQNQRYTT